MPHGVLPGPWERSAKGSTSLAQFAEAAFMTESEGSILFHVKHFCGKNFSKMGSRDMICRAAGNVKFFFGV